MSKLDELLALDSDEGKPKSRLDDLLAVDGPKKKKPNGKLDDLLALDAPGETASKTPEEQTQDLVARNENEAWDAGVQGVKDAFAQMIPFRRSRVQSPRELAPAPNAGFGGSVGDFASNMVGGMGEVLAPAAAGALAGPVASVSAGAGGAMTGGLEQAGERRRLEEIHRRERLSNDAERFGVDFDPKSVDPGAEFGENRITLGDFAEAGVGAALTAGGMGVAQQALSKAAMAVREGAPVKQEAVRAALKMLGYDAASGVAQGITSAIANGIDPTSPEGRKIILQAAGTQAGMSLAGNAVGARGMLKPMMRAREAFNLDSATQIPTVAHEPSLRSMERVLSADPERMMAVRDAVSPQPEGWSGPELLPEGGSPEMQSFLRQEQAYADDEARASAVQTPLFGRKGGRKKIIGKNMFAAERGTWTPEQPKNPDFIGTENGGIYRPGDNFPVVPVAPKPKWLAESEALVGPFEQPAPQPELPGTPVEGGQTLESPVVQRNPETKEVVPSGLQEQEGRMQEGRQEGLLTPEGSVIESSAGGEVAPPAAPEVDPVIAERDRLLAIPNRTREQQNRLVAINRKLGAAKAPEIADLSAVKARLAVRDSLVNVPDEYRPESATIEDVTAPPDVGVVQGDSDATADMRGFTPEPRTIKQDLTVADQAAMADETQPEAVPEPTKAEVVAAKLAERKARKSMMRGKNPPQTPNATEPADLLGDSILEGSTIPRPVPKQMGRGRFGPKNKGFAVLPGGGPKPKVAPTPEEAEAIRVGRERITTTRGEFGTQMPRTVQAKARVFDSQAGFDYAEKALGLNPKDDPESSAYIAQRTLPGLPGKIGVDFKEGVQLPVDGVTRTVTEPIDNWIADFREVKGDYENYANTLRDLERVRMDKGDANFDVQAAQTRVNYYERAFPKFKAMQKRFRAIMDGMVDVLKDSGIVTKERADELKKGEYWVHQERDGFDAEADALKQIKKDVDARVVNPIEGSIKTLMVFRQMAERNKALQKVADLGYAGSPFVKVLKRGAESPGKDHVAFKINGETRYMKLDPLLHEAVTASPQAAGVVGNVLNGFSDLYRAGVTLSPKYMIRNILRDTYHGAVISEYSNFPFEQWARGISESAGEYFGKQGKSMAKFMRSGGDQGTEMAFVYDSDGRMRDKILMEASRTPIQKAFAAAKSPLDTLQLINKYFGEQPTRVGEFKKVMETSYKRFIEAGQDEKKAARNAELLAAYEARNLMDFGMGGLATAKYKRSAAFFGAQLSGTYRDFQALKNPKTWAKAALYYTVPAIAQEIMLADDKDYQRLPNVAKWAAWWVKLPGVGLVPIKIQGGPVTMLFKALPQAMMQKVKQDNPNAFGGIAQYFASDIIPNPIPTAIRPPVELKTNYSLFQQRPIVGQELQNLPAKEQYDESTSLTAKALSSGIARGTKIASDWASRMVGSDIGGELELSPKKVDYAVQSFLGPVGRNVVANTSDRVVSAFTGERLPNAHTGTEILTKDLNPLYGFAEEQYKQGSVITDEFYKRFQKAQSESNAINRNRRGYKPDPQLSAMRKANEKMGEIRDMMRRETDPERRMKYKAAIEQLALPFVKVGIGARSGRSMYR